MTATITVKTHESKGVSRVPNAALRYKPSPPKGPDGKPIPQPPDAPLQKGEGHIWVVTSDKPGDEKAEMRKVHVGVTDGMFTELTGDDAPAVSTKIVTDENEGDDKKKGPF
jgi:HlyD family secretion protein